MGRATLHPVVLAPGERARLEALTKSGSAQAQVIRRAQIFLLLDRGKQGPGWEDAHVAQACGVNLRTLGRLRARFVQERLGAIEHHAPEHYRPRKIDGDGEAQLVMIACSEPPAGHARWSLRLLADKLASLDIDVSYETVRRTLKKMPSSRGCTNAGASHRGKTRRSSVRWKTSSKSTNGRSIRRGR